jgi:hypothetical protein
MSISHWRAQKESKKLKNCQNTFFDLKSLFLKRNVKYVISLSCPVISDGGAPIYSLVSKSQEGYSWRVKNNIGA